jgi:HPt (histidine-containing phosphotransfer) domain-containing protein
MDSKQPEQVDQVSRSWASARPSVQSRVKVLEVAFVSALRDNLRDHQRHQAIGTAHQLAGSLDAYRLSEGSSLAEKLEAGFQEDIEKDTDRLRETGRDLENLIEIVGKAA